MQQFFFFFLQSIEKQGLERRNMHLIFPEQIHLSNQSGSQTGAAAESSPVLTGWNVKDLLKNEAGNVKVHVMWLANLRAKNAL